MTYEQIETLLSDSENTSRIKFVETFGIFDTKLNYTIVSSIMAAKLNSDNKCYTVTLTKENIESKLDGTIDDVVAIEIALCENYEQQQEANTDIEIALCDIYETISEKEGEEDGANLCESDNQGEENI